MARKSGWLDAIGIAFVTLLAFAAFDDITTDNDTNFTVEYVALAICALWLCVVSIRLVRGRHRRLGSVSFVALAGALWAQRSIGPGITPGFWPAYLVMAAVFLWFGLLAVLLFVRSQRDA
jgi:hypothetical protein